MKKLTRLFFVFIFIIACLALFASCGEEEYSKGLDYGTYYEIDQYATVHGIGSCKDTKIIIPEKDDYGREVTTVHDLSGTEDCSHITEIILPETIHWFQYHYLDLTATMPNLKYNEYGNAKYLGTKTNPYFALITSLDTESTEAIIHPDTKIIAVQAFKGKDNLKTINIPEGVRFLSSAAFIGCKNLVNLTIPKSLLGQYEWAFAECTSLKSVTIPGTLKTVNSGMFIDCTSLESVTLEEGVEIIANYAFEGCTALKNINFPSTVTTIHNSVFEDCESLIKVELNDGLSFVGGETFRNCKNLETVRIPSSLTALARDTFDGCDKLEYNKYNNCLYLSNEENPYLILVKSAYKDIKEVDISSSTSIILGYAFSDCENLESVSIPEGIKTLYGYTFRNCSKLSSVSLPSTIKKFDEYAFDGCTSLRYININVTKEYWNTVIKPELSDAWTKNSAIIAVYCTDEVIGLTK